MKFLHLQHPHNPEHSVGNEYMADMIFLGGRLLYGKDYVDANKQCWMYNVNCNERNFIWGGGFTLYNRLEDIEVDRNDIENKIKNRYFDYIIYPCPQIYDEYIDLVTSVYPKNKIIIIDGSDFKGIRTPHWQKGIFFKRETLDPTAAIPISYCVPAANFTRVLPKDKEKLIAECIPGDKSTYIFREESDYNNDYRKSYFGITCVKQGVDCCRHVEIISNCCFPYFYDINRIPDSIMIHYPKDIMKEYISNIKTEWDWKSDITNFKFGKAQYWDYTLKVFEHGKKHLTCEAMFQYMLNAADLKNCKFYF